MVLTPAYLKLGIEGLTTGPDIFNSERRGAMINEFLVSLAASLVGGAILEYIQESRRELR